MSHSFVKKAVHMNEKKMAALEVSYIEQGVVK